MKTALSATFKVSEIARTDDGRILRLLDPLWESVPLPKPPRGNCAVHITNKHLFPAIDAINPGEYFLVVLTPLP